MVTFPLELPSGIAILKSVAAYERNDLGALTLFIVATPARTFQFN